MKIIISGNAELHKHFSVQALICDSFYFQSSNSTFSGNSPLLNVTSLCAIAFVVFVRSTIDLSYLKYKAIHGTLESVHDFFDLY